MTALGTTIWFLADPKCTKRLVDYAVRFCMVLQYYKHGHIQVKALKDGKLQR